MDGQKQVVTRRSFAIGMTGLAASAALGLASCGQRSANALGQDDLADLAKMFGGKIITPADPDAYATGRAIWDGLYDFHPAAIVPCRSAADVAKCIKFATKRKLITSIRSGGHHPAGFAMNDGGLVIDLSAMKQLTVDKAKQTVIIGPGVLVGEMDAACEAMGLVVPAAACPTVGMGGMTSGGGEGWMGEFGLTIDNLTAAEVVLADGRIVRTDATSEPDLFWAIRGGGGNFGVLTAMEFRAHVVQPLMFGVFAYPLPASREVGLKWRDHCLTAAPDFASVCAYVRKPMPAMVMMAKTGRAPDAAQAEFAQLKTFGPAVQEMVRPVSLTELQLGGASGSEAGFRYFSLVHYFVTLPDTIFDLAAAAMAKAPTPEAAILIHSQSKGVNQVPVSATAYPHRGPHFTVHAQSRWDKPDADTANKQWVQDFWDSLLPLATGEVYGNYVSTADQDTSIRAYGPNLARLAQIKAKFDPGNFFQRNINILPA